MSSKKDLVSLGEAYGNVLNKVVVSEEVPVGEIGEAPLETGGPEERGGFRPSEIDITKLSDKKKEDNVYNIGGLTYGDGNDPGISNQSPEPTGPEYAQVPYSGVVGNEEDEEDDDEWNKAENEREEARDRGEEAKKKGDWKKWNKEENKREAAKDKARSLKEEEDEEILAEHEKIARAGLNNFMSKQSVFDKLYNKVMVNEDFGEEVDDVTELEALGIETPDEVVDDVPEEISVTIPGELAQHLSDVLQTALAEQETDVDIDVDVEDDHWEEDEEAAMKDGGGAGVDAGSTLKKEINYGKKNKVGKLHPAGSAVKKDGGGYGVDAGSTLSKEINYGKQNKVGTTKLGSIPGA